MRKERFSNRPTIRISSTFFWHLSSDYDLAPIPSLAERARDMKNIDGITKDADDVIYPPMKVGHQVSKCVLVPASSFVSAYSQTALQ